MDAVFSDTKYNDEKMALWERNYLANFNKVQSERFLPSFLIKMHEKRGNFCIFLLKIAEKEGKTDLVIGSRAFLNRMSALNVPPIAPN